MLAPFQQPDFNGWYVIFGLFISLYWFRGGAWNQGFTAAAKSPHEGRMAAILGNWRGYSAAAMSALVSLGAFTLLHNPSYAAQRVQVANTLAGISLPQLRSQMQMPVAMGVLLIPGIKGCFCAVLFFGLLAGQGQQLHSYGSTFLQDVFLPMCKAPLTPRAHILYLKLMVFGVALFACLLSVWFKPVDYLVLAVQLLSTLYLGGIGLVVWGGLYWKKGTTAAAWTSMITGSSLSVIFFIFQQKWTAIQLRLLTHLSNHAGLWHYLAAHAAKCPLNGQQLTLITVVLSAIGYVSVSLLTCQEDFDLDAMLGRGKHGDLRPEPRNRPWLARVLNIDEHFTRGDKMLTYTTFGFTLVLQGTAVLVAVWTVLVHHLSPSWWFNYMLITCVGVALVVAVPTTIWFTIGVASDLRNLLVTLKSARRIDSDDGTARRPEFPPVMPPVHRFTGDQADENRIQQTHGQARIYSQE